jgi:hypothetical protein
MKLLTIKQIATTRGSTNRKKKTPALGRLSCIGIVLSDRIGSEKAGLRLAHLSIGFGNGQGLSCCAFSIEASADRISINGVIVRNTPGLTIEHPAYKFHSFVGCVNHKQFLYPVFWHTGTY